MTNTTTTTTTPTSTTKPKSTRTRHQHKETAWARKFSCITSTNEWRKMHKKLAKVAQTALIVEMDQKVRAIDKKLMSLDPSNPDAVAMRSQARSLREDIAEIRKTPLLRPREALRMGY